MTGLSAIQDADSTQPSRSEPGRRRLISKFAAASRCRHDAASSDRWQSSSADATSAEVTGAPSHLAALRGAAPLPLGHGLARFSESIAKPAFSESVGSRCAENMGRATQIYHSQNDSRKMFRFHPETAKDIRHVVESIV